MSKGLVTELLDAEVVSSVHTVIPPETMDEKLRARLIVQIKKAEAELRITKPTKPHPLGGRYETVNPGGGPLLPGKRYSRKWVAFPNVPNPRYQQLVNEITRLHNEIVILNGLIGNAI